MENKNIKFVFLGSGPLAESALYSLYENDLIPSLVITSPDKKAGRNLEIKKNIIATWCENKDIKVWQPESLKNIDIRKTPLYEESFDTAIVASYPKILTKEILEIPKFGMINIHPSPLSKYRGPSPIQTALLNGEEKTSITIIKLDEEMDHGPILIQREVNILEEDMNEILERKCGAIGGEMVAEILPHYLEGNLKLIEQNHTEATFTRKFEKKDGEIKLEDSAEILQNKFKALLPHIPIYFFLTPSVSLRETASPREANIHKAHIEETASLGEAPRSGDGLNLEEIKKIRVKITKINLNKDFAKDKLAKDIIEKVIPEGKSEMNFSDFERGYLKS